MYELLIFLGMTQLILGLLFGAIGTLIVVVNRIVGEYENQATKLARRLGFAGLWLILIGFVTVMAVIVANWPVRRA